MCEKCPNLLSCNMRHCGSYAFGRLSVADIFLAQERRRRAKAICETDACPVREGRENKTPLQTR